METDNFEIKENPVVDDAEAEMLDRAEVLQVLIRQPGWKYLEHFIANNIRAFTNKAIKEGFDDMGDYQFERGKVHGFSSLLAQVEDSIESANAIKNAKKPAA